MATSSFVYLSDRRRHSSLSIALAIGLFLTVADAEARYASIVIDAHSGEVLHEENADTQNYPASLTKMMTLYLVFEALEDRRLSLSRRLWVSEHAASQVPSKLGLNPGERITVEQAILALVTKSANDAAVVLAEALGGTESRFAQMMTTRARRLGMRRTQFRNASGLPHRNQRSTARDMATLAVALTRDFPQYYHYFSTKSFVFRGRRYTTHNHLLKTYRGADGIKTGYTRASGYNLAASVRRDGRRLVAVVFGGRTARSRDRHIVSLLDQGLANSTRLAKNPVVREKLRIADNRHRVARVPRERVNRKTQAPIKRIIPIRKAVKDTATVRRISRPFERLAAREAGLRTVSSGSGAWDVRRPESVRAGQTVPIARVSEPSSSAMSRPSHSDRRAVNQAPQRKVARPDAIAALAPGQSDTPMADETVIQPDPEQAFIQAQRVVAVTDTSAPPSALPLKHTALAKETISGPVASVRPMAAPHKLGPFGVQVGAFSSHVAAHTAAATAVRQFPVLLGNARVWVIPRESARGHLFLARLLGMTKSGAQAACQQLQASGFDCIAVGIGSAQALPVAALP